MLRHNSEQSQYRQHSIHSSGRSRSNFVEPGMNLRPSVERSGEHQSVRSPHCFCQPRRHRPSVVHGLGERGVRSLSPSISRSLRYLLDWNLCTGTAPVISYSSDTQASVHHSVSSVVGLLRVRVSVCDPLIGFFRSRTIQTSKIPPPKTSSTAGHRQDEGLGKNPEGRRQQTLGACKLGVLLAAT